MRKQPKDMPDAHWQHCKIFALNFAKQNGWYMGISNPDLITKKTNHGFGYEIFEQGINMAVVTYNYWKQIIPEHVVLEKVVSCRGIDSKIRDYDAELGRRQAETPSDEKNKSAELVQERKFIRKLLEEINRGGCSIESLECFRSPQK